MALGMGLVQYPAREVTLQVIGDDLLDGTRERSFKEVKEVVQKKYGYDLTPIAFGLARKAKGLRKMDSTKRRETSDRKPQAQPMKFDSIEADLRKLEVKLEQFEALKKGLKILLAAVGE